jgi:NDP-sugar pyrophosphorylase family protein
VLWEAVVHTAMILAAGLGTRLRPLTLERPKPLVEVLGTPLVHLALEHARRAGARRVALNTHHLHPAVPEALGDRFFDLELVYSHEPEVLGTGGGVRQMAERLGVLRGPFFLYNADALLDLDTAGLVAAHETRAPLATLALKDTPDKERFGLLGTDEHDLVRTFAGRTAYQGAVFRERMFCGAHVLDPRMLGWLPPGASCINQVGYPRVLDEGHAVLGFDVPGYFCDVGTPERLLEASFLLLGGEVRLEHVDLLSRFGAEGRRFEAAGARIAAGARLVPPVLVDEGAVLEKGCVVGPYAVVGKGCVVGRGAVVERSVLQSGARVAPGEAVRGALLGAGCRSQVESLAPVAW